MIVHAAGPFVAIHRMGVYRRFGPPGQYRNGPERPGTLEGSARVSRIDLYVDFVSDLDMEAWGRTAWLTRARSVNAYAVDDRFSGWAIGMGGPMAARLYDKTLELAKSGKNWLKPLWMTRGSTP